jgi:hypothetical protein
VTIIFGGHSVLSIGMGSLKGVMWSIAIEKCPRRLVEVSKSEITFLKTNNCFTFVVTVRIFKGFKHHVINFLGKHLYYQCMHLLVVI